MFIRNTELLLSLLVLEASKIPLSAKNADLSKVTLGSVKALSIWFDLKSKSHMVEFVSIIVQVVSDR